MAINTSSKTPLDDSDRLDSDIHAAQLLNTTLKLVEKNGQRYIIPRHKTLAELSFKEQHHAHLAYLKLEPRFERTQQLKKNADKHSHKKELDHHLSSYIQLKQERQLINHALETLKKLVISDNYTNNMIPTPTNQRKPVLNRANTRLRPASATNPITKIAPSRTISAAQLATRQQQVRSQNIQLQNTQSLNNKGQPTPGIPLSPILLQAILRIKFGQVSQNLQRQNPSLSKDRTPGKTPTPATTIEPSTTEPSTAPTPFDITPRPS